MWERDQWRREKDRAREATAAVAASMGLRMTSPHRLELQQGGGGGGGGGADSARGGDGTGLASPAAAGFMPLERFPLVALMPFCPSASDGARENASAR